MGRSLRQKLMEYGENINESSRWEETKDLNKDEIVGSLLLLLSYQPKQKLARRGALDTAVCRVLPKARLEWFASYWTGISKQRLHQEALNVPGSSSTSVMLAMGAKNLSSFYVTQQANSSGDGQSILIDLMTKWRTLSDPNYTMLVMIQALRKPRTQLLHWRGKPPEGRGIRQKSTKHA